MHARTLRMCVREPRRVTHSNKLATVLTTVQADICDGKLWTKGGTAREERRGEQGREREREEKRRPEERDTVAASSATSTGGECTVRWMSTYVLLPTILFTNYFICPAYSN